MRFTSELLVWVLDTYFATRKRTRVDSTTSVPGNESASSAPDVNGPHPLETARRRVDEAYAAHVYLAKRARRWVDQAYGAHLFIGIAISVTLSLMLLEELGFMNYDRWALFWVLSLILFFPLAIAAFIAIASGILFSIVTPRDWRLGVLSVVLDRRRCQTCLTCLGGRGGGKGVGSLF